MRKRLLLLFLIGIIGFIIYKGNTTIGTTYYELKLDSLPESFNSYTIVQLSDLHDAEFGENNHDIVEAVKSIAPHAIFITGDFIDRNRYDLENSLSIVEKLRFVAPIYYVTGNHEISTNDIGRIKKALADLGVHVLSNDVKVMTTVQGDKIAIGGIEDPLASPLSDAAAVAESIDSAFQNIPKEMFKILLSHRPEQFEVYAANGIHVTFSGHAHGGQFRFPGVGGLISPGQGWFPKLTSGVHEKNGHWLVVSRGLGNSLVPIRIFNRPEIVVVTLKNN